MLKFHFHRLGLCQEASEDSPAPSGAPAEPSAPAVEVPSQTPPQPEVKAGVKDKIKALMAGASGNAQTIANLQLQVQNLTAQRDAAELQILSLQSEVIRLASDNTHLSAEARSVEDALAGIGIPQAQLPAQAPAGSAPALTAAETALAAEAETDPVKKGQLARQSMNLLRMEAAARSAPGSKN